MNESISDDLKSYFNKVKKFPQIGGMLELG